MPATWVLVSLLAAASSSAPAAEKDGVFVLPVEGRWPVSDSAATVFEERLTIAFAEGRRLRAVASRDVPASKRGRLPDKLSACTDAECVKKLAEIMGVDRVLEVRLADDAGRVTCFSTVRDGRSGAVVQRKEWPGAYGEAGIPRELALAIARWTLGEQRTRTAPPVSKPVTVQPGVLALGLAARQTETPETRALLAELAGRLQGRSDFSVVREGAAKPGEISQRAGVLVDHVAISSRQHHVRHYRDGSLQATLTISEASSGVVLLSVRGDAKFSEEADHVTDAQALGTLVTRVVDQWMRAFDAQQVSEKLRRKVSP
jgi:hypothetical protein